MYVLLLGCTMIEKEVIDWTNVENFKIDPNTDRCESGVIFFESHHTMYEAQCNVTFFDKDSKPREYHVIL